MTGRCRTRRCVVRMVASILIMMGTTMAAPAQSFKTIFSFNGTDGATPDMMTLVRDKVGNLYGTTNSGGAFSGGTVFKLTPSGKLTTLYSFCRQSNCADGTNPVSGLVLGMDGSFYGTTIQGGAGAGTVFKITPQGKLTILHSFNVADGALPTAALVQGGDRNFYGTASAGGNTSACPAFSNGGCGTVFKITPNGRFTLLHLFNLTDGATPSAALIQAADGKLYGTTFQGGAGGLGTVFKITPTGTLKTLHSFAGNDGQYPSGVLLEIAKGVFYGTAGFGGVNGDGTVFKITSNSTLTTLHNFDLTDGYIPSGVLVRAKDGNLYGVTESGGAKGGLGTIFRMTLAGRLTTLHTFCLKAHCSDGAYPDGGLVGSTNGTFYGTATAGGALGYGTVFSFAIGEPER
jgi:uncharacterized repeat protein (TIGR03803 family)